MKRATLLISAWTLTLFTAGAEPAPTLESVFEELGLALSLEDEIRIEGSTQGVFVKVEEEVRVHPIAKYPNDRNADATRLRVGFYYQGNPSDLRQLFECGALADGQANLDGLPMRPNLPSASFDPKLRLFGFYAQSAAWNPRFRADGDTVFSQPRLNQRIERFEDESERLRIFPYRIGEETIENWYVLCWDVTGEGLYQDLVMVVRGVKLLRPLPNPVDEPGVEAEQPQPRRLPSDDTPYAITMR